MGDRLIRKESGSENENLPLYGKLLPVCFLCNRVPPDGIRDGFFLRGIFICTQCEQELIQSRPEEKEEYMLAIAKLRNILFKDKPWY